MYKKQLWKNIKKSITHSWGRFISIMLLMALGSFALVGLFVTGPNMRETGKHYFDKYNVADITILSDYGIDKSEQESIEKAKGIKELEYIYLKDAVISDTNTSIRIFSKPDKISKYEVTEGKLPEDNNEIAIGNNLKDKYKIGDTINFVEKEAEDGSKTLKRTDFKVVGYINSSEILSKINMGQTTVGTGELNGYAIINSDNFDSSVYMMAKMKFDDIANIDPYTNDYNSKLQKHKDELSNLLKGQQETRFVSIKQEYQDKINEGQSKIDDAKKELDDARQQLDDAKVKLDNAKNEIDENTLKLENAKKLIDNGDKEIASNEKLLQDKENEYKTGENLFNSKKNEYLQGKKELENKKKEYELAKSKIEETEKKLNNNKQSLEDGKKKYESGISSLEQGIKVIENKLNDSNVTSEVKVELNKQLIGYKQKLSKTKKEYESFINKTYTPSIKKIEAGVEQVNAKKTELDSAKKQIEEADKKIQDGKKQLDTYKKQLANANLELSSGKKKLEAAKTKLINSKKVYDKGKKELEEGKNEYLEKEKEYNEKLTEFNNKEPDANSKIEEGEKKLKDSKEKLAKLEEPTYSVDNRRELPGGEGYSVYETVSEIIDSLAKVFPVFLYFVAALVTLTTMTRFVNEERVNSGTLKSLGYQDKDIIKKFTFYGFIAGTVGTAIGITLGHTLLPDIVYNAYGHAFSLPKMELHFNLGITVLSMILSFISSVVPAFIVAKKELQEVPADLLQPKAPKAGSKIFLERIKPIWSKMKFTHKVTCRNIFRYKNRMFMTIFGVAGAVAVLFTGFSVQSSISGINKRQFEDLIKYDAIVALNTDKDNSEDSLSELLNSKDVKQYMSVYYEEVTKQAGRNNDTQSIKLIVPETKESLEEYISLINRKTGKKLEFSDDGAIISERLANILNVSKGDSFTFKDSADKERTVKVLDICEMYAGHFMFMTSNEYEKIYNKKLETNAKLVDFADNSLENTKKLSAKFMQLSCVKGVVQNTTLYNQIDTIVKALNKIMIVLIIVATMLAIVILYNLTNINVAERIRELCTIKVLGFRDKEVTMYIYRETIILSALGIVVGWFIGLLLHNYILNVVPPDEVMFNPTIWIGAYIIPLVTVAIVSFVLKYYVNNKLRNIDMLEALKSVD